MSTAKLIFITGPSGAGKSTTAKEVASKWPSTCALLDFDKIRTLIKAGYAEPALEWNDETASQWGLAMQVIKAMAQAYIDNNVSVVVEVFATPSDLSKWQALFGDIPFRAFVLLPDLDVVIARNEERKGVTKLMEHKVRENYEWSVGWSKISGITILDNGHAEVADIAIKIMKFSQQ